MNRVEFIESYIKQDGDADYVWNDNHGVLVRCKDCKHWKPGYITDKDDFIPPSCGYPNVVGHSSDDYCSYGEAREDNE